MDLTGLCAQYTAYLEIMSHWEKLLPGRVQHVVYEDLALDPENELRRVLKVLGLPWEKEVLQAHRWETDTQTVTLVIVLLSLC